MGFLEEAMNDFFKNQTFFTAAKKYQPELKKQILAFLLRKGITATYSSYDFEPQINIKNTLGAEGKAKRGAFNSIINKIEFGSNFFAASSNYESKLRFPKIIYKDFVVYIEIQSNEDFFENGHDLIIQINPYIDNKMSYDSKTKKYKLNLFENINQVLEKMWVYVEQTISNYNSIEQPISNQPKKVAENEIRNIVRLYLNTYYNILKSGKKNKITDSSKQPAEFYLVINHDKNPNSTFNTKINQTFELRFKIRQLDKNVEKSSGYHANAIVSDSIKNMFPDYKIWIDIYNTANEDMGVKFYQLSFENLFGEKNYGEQHLAILNRLRKVCERFLKMGYVPTGSHIPYNKRDEATIIFTYYDKIEKEAQKNPAFIAKFFKGTEYKKYVENTFFYQGKDIRKAPERLIAMVFTQLGNK